MIDLLFKFLLNPGALTVFVAAAFVLAAVWFTLGPARVYGLLRNWKTWAIILVLAVGVSWADMSRKVDTLTEEVAIVEHQKDAKDDAATVVERARERTRQRHENQSRQQEAIHDAEPGQELDALLDEIDRQQRGGPDAPERVRDGADGVVRP